MGSSQGQALWSVTLCSHIALTPETLVLKPNASARLASPEGSDFHSNRLTHRTLVVSRELRGCWTRPGLCSTLPSMLCSVYTAEPRPGPVLTACHHGDPGLWLERLGILCGALFSLISVSLSQEHPRAGSYSFLLQNERRVRPSLCPGGRAQPRVSRAWGIHLRCSHTLLLEIPHTCLSSHRLLPCAGW